MERPKHCQHQKEDGTQCKGYSTKFGPDPDGVWRCMGHSHHPQAEEKREAQRQAGRKGGKKIYEDRKEARKAARTAKKSPVKGPAPVKAEIIQLAAKSSPSPSPDLTPLGELIQKADLSNPRDRLNVLQKLLSAVVASEIDSRECDAAVKCVKVAAEQKASDLDNKGTVVKFKTVRSKKDAEPFKDSA